MRNSVRDDDAAHMNSPMDHEHFKSPGGPHIRVPHDNAYCTCSVCSGDCIPDASGADRLGVRPEHGVHRVAAPLGALR